MSELKPCPFCGGPARPKGDMAVGCDKCGAGAYKGVWQNPFYLKRLGKPDFSAALEKAWIEHVKRYYSGIEPDIPQPKIKYTQAFRAGWDARGGGK